MKLPRPEVGMVFRYAYLWADEHERGAEDGRKDRPVLALAIAVTSESGDVEVMVLAATHSPPRRKVDAVEFPPSLKRAIGLDDNPAWIVTAEANAFIWPGPDLRPVAGRKPETPVYGRVPRSLLKDVAISYLANRKRRASRTVKR